MSLFHDTMANPSEKEGSNRYALFALSCEPSDQFMINESLLVDFECVSRRWSPRWGNAFVRSIKHPISGQLVAACEYRLELNDISGAYPLAIAVRIIGDFPVFHLL